MELKEVAAADVVDDEVDDDGSAIIMIRDIPIAAIGIGLEDLRLYAPPPFSFIYSTDANDLPCST